MSLETGFGHIHNILDEKPEYAKRLKVASPILMKEKFDVLKSFGDSKSPRYDEYYKNKTFSTTFKNDLKTALENLAEKVISSVKNDNVSIVFLSDKNISEETKLIPMAMAVGFVNESLIKANLRNKVSLIAVTGEVYDPHMAAVMVAYGVTAIYPYMMYASVHELHKTKVTSKYQMQTLLKNTQKALNAGLLKIMSKMGICTIASYRNSRLFDIIGFK